MARALRSADMASAVSLAETYANSSVITSPVTGSGLRPLHYAALLGNPTLIQVLLRNGANVDGTALKLAASHGSTEALRQLILSAPDGMVRKAGGLAVFEAAFAGAVDCVRILLNAGAPATYRGSDGSTPLHYAALCGSIAMVDSLLAAGASPRLTSHDGCTPAMAARRVGHMAVVNRLRAALTAELDAVVIPQAPLQLSPPAPVSSSMDGIPDVCSVELSGDFDDEACGCSAGSSDSTAEPPCGHKSCMDNVFSSPRTVAPLPPTCVAPPWR